MVDIRVEDMIPGPVIFERRLFNTIGRFPDISAAGQHSKFFIATYGTFDRFESDPTVIEQLVSTGHYLLLPDSPESEFWQYTQSPWWEYCEVLDKYDNPIKAPKVFRDGRDTANADEIDERLDEFEENRGTIQVLSPITIMNMRKKRLQPESLARKLKRLVG
jgi:IS4 transposase